MGEGCEWGARTEGSVEIPVYSLKQATECLPGKKWILCTNMQNTLWDSSFQTLGFPVMNLLGFVGPRWRTPNPEEWMRAPPSGHPA